MNEFSKLLFSSILSVGTQIYAASRILNVKPNLRGIKEILSILLAIFA